MTKKQIIRREIFYFISGLFVLLAGLEIIWPHIVLAYFNLNWLAVLWFLAGLYILIKR